ncbi:iron(III) transport system substrate-binding protein [Sphaerochaeta associata]|uniref:ABC transporter substrate-binding protein n=1 Tax=Sphaerochaeta associata TaxID=1129264 RepID=A0ABY4DBC4_9SPIR|nr:ABC transporter substrate-binding protein [Sphaerochaeta associata]UOM51112.1 ABC transporter substrate-binding protein [Sphaerochaeta associata]SMP65900.1 iron(III) transport system substrate-binding protein [Sphaerochaeta associata]
MKKSIALLIIMVLFVAMTPMFAQGSNEQPQTLTVYVGLLEEHGAAICQAFEKATGIKTQYVRMSGGEIFARIKAESQNPQASVWYGGGSLTFIEADNNGLLERYVSPNAAIISDKFKDPNGAWTGIYSGYLGFYADGDWLKRNNVAMPKTWNDLLNPAFKGEIVMAHPGSSSTAYNMLTTILQLQGEEKGWDYLLKLNDNIRQYTKSGSAGGRMVQLHETALTIGYLHDAVAFKREGYDHIVIAAPEDGTGYEIGAVGIIKGAPQLAAAKKFVDFVLTAEAQEIGQTVNALQFLTNPNARPPKEVESIKNAKLINQDDAWSGANRSDFLNKFNQLTRTAPPK